MASAYPFCSRLRQRAVWVTVGKRPYRSSLPSLLLLRMPCLGCVRPDSGLGHAGALAGITLANGVLFSGRWGASTVTFPGVKFLRFKYGYIRRLDNDKVASSPQLLMFAMVPFVVSSLLPVCCSMDLRTGYDVCCTPM